MTKRVEPMPQYFLCQHKQVCLAFTCVLKIIQSAPLICTSVMSTLQLFA